MKIDHIGIATRGVGEASRFWRDNLGLESAETEEIAEQKVRVMMLPIGEASIELLEATSPDSPIARFLEKRGPGIHHVAIRVDNIHAALEQFKQQGARVIDSVPRPGANGCLVAFVHPSSTGGVLLELVENRSR